MPRPSALSRDEVDRQLAELDGWSLRDDKLHRDFAFADFVRAFSFMTQIALVAEKMDHHPEWSNVYNRVAVDLTTHDAKGITSLDFELASFMDSAAKTLGR